MTQALLWAAAGTGFTFLMTALGASLVFLLRRRSNPLLQRVFLGFAAGVMIAASVWSPVSYTHLIREHTGHNIDRSHVRRHLLPHQEHHARHVVAKVQLTGLNVNIAGQDIVPVSYTHLL